MIGLLIWLSAFALTNITARPVAEPYDLYTPTTDAIFTDNYSPADRSFTEAATFKHEEPNDEEPKINPAEQNVRNSIQDLLDAMYAGRFSAPDFDRMYDEEHDKWVDKKLRWALGQDQEETRPVEGQNESPQDENQPSTDDEGLNFKSINQDQLVKFVEISETMAPQYGIGLKGIKLTEAIILAIPGFIAGLRGGWHPVGL